MPKPYIFSPSYLAMVRGTRELHRLIAAGQEDSPEADAIRDATDEPWEALSEIERNRVRNLSEDLYSLIEPSGELKSMMPSVQMKLMDSFDARQRGDWDRALSLLRELSLYLDPAVISALRGSIWQEAGDSETALVFLKDAVHRQPTNEQYLALLLTALFRSDKDSALKYAESVLGRFENHSLLVVALAIQIQLESVKSGPVADARKVVEGLITTLKTALSESERTEKISKEPKYILSLILLGNCCEFVGNRSAALEFYTRVLEIDPENEGILVARGILQYGKSTVAIKDFELAMKLGTSYLWPYVFLAHNHLQKRRFEECLRLCERALNLEGANTIKSEIYEWIAISQAELGFPSKMIEYSFHNAIRLDPANERAVANLMIFKDGMREVENKEWVTLSSAAIQTIGLVERKLTAVA